MIDESGLALFLRSTASKYILNNKRLSADQPPAL